MSDPSPILPAHIAETVQAIARLHAHHHAQATPLEKLSDAVTRRIGRPVFLGGLTVAVIGWAALNLVLGASGRRAPDPPPFYWMQGLVSLSALYVTSMVLATQRREDELAGLREQLTLELAIVSEQKAAKIIALMEELRRDSPAVPDRPDHEAAAMATTADPQAVLDAIKAGHETIAAGGTDASAVPAGPAPGG